MKARWRRRPRSALHDRLSTLIRDAVARPSASAAPIFLTEEEQGRNIWWQEYEEGESIGSRPLCWKNLPALSHF
jgi:hypothetical protein